MRGSVLLVVLAPVVLVLVALLLAGLQDRLGPYRPRNKDIRRFRGRNAADDGRPAPPAA